MNSLPILPEKLPRIYIHRGAVNMSYSFDGLLNIIKATLKRPARQGELYCFFNRARSRCKMLFLSDGRRSIVYQEKVDRNIFKLEEGRGCKVVKAVELSRLLQFISKNGGSNGKH